MPSSKTAKKKPIKKKVTKKKPIKKKVTKKKVVKKTLPSYIDKLIREVTDDEIGLDNINYLFDIVSNWAPKAYDYASDLASKYVPYPML